MKATSVRSKFLGVAPATVLIVLGIAACGGCGSGASEVPPPRTPTPIDPATLGTIKGRVWFDGPRPKVGIIAMGNDPVCAGTEHPDDQLVVNEGPGGKLVLKNAFVWISDGLGGKVYPYPTSPKVSDQTGCMFSPHVLGVQVGQTVVFRNNDATAHNVNTLKTTTEKNPKWNFTLASKGTEKSLWFPAEGTMKMVCNAHSWMGTWIHVVDHPHFQVTGDDGSFELRDVPAGTYTLSCWSESCNPGQKDEKSVKVEAKGTTQVDFTFQPRK